MYINTVRYYSMFVISGKMCVFTQHIVYGSCYVFLLVPPTTNSFQPSGKFIEKNEHS